MLHPESLVVQQTDGVEHAQALRFGQFLCLRLFLLEDGAAQFQFASGDDRLLDKTAMLATRGRAANLRSVVPHTGIRVEAGLQRASDCGLHLRRCLGESGIAFQRHRFELFERETGLGRWSLSLLTARSGWRAMQVLTHLVFSYCDSAYPEQSRSGFTEQPRQHTDAHHPEDNSNAKKRMLHGISPLRFPHAVIGKLS